MSLPHRGRRSDYAEATRLATIEAVRLPFSRKGYFMTTVEDMAKEARGVPTAVLNSALVQQATTARRTSPRLT
ncbi:hypothetical protein ACWF94_09290 [Streptomyces sp. NPDC055078]